MKYLLLLLFVVNYSYAQDCKCIEKETDKFKGKISWHSDYLSGLRFRHVSFSKYISNNDTNIYLYLTAYGTTLNVGEKGATLLFDNGGKIEKPDVKIDVHGANNGWDYSAHIKLDDEDLELLTTSLLTDYELYIYDAKLAEGKSKTVQKYAKCIVEAK